MYYGVISPHQTSFSSFAIIPGISPTDNIMLINSKNVSFLTSASVKRKVIPYPK